MQFYVISLESLDVFRESVLYLNRIKIDNIVIE